MGVSDGSTVVGHDVGDLVLANRLSDHLAELEAGLLLVDLVGLEAAADVVEDSEVLIGFFNSNNVHLAEGVPVVSADLAVNLDEALLVLHNLSGLVSGEGVLESLLEKHAQGDALSQLVGTSRGSGGVDSLKLSEVPLLGSSHSLNDLSLSFVALHPVSGSQQGVFLLTILIGYNNNKTPDFPHFLPKPVQEPQVSFPRRVDLLDSEGVHAPGISLITALTSPHSSWIRKY